MCGPVMSVDSIGGFSVVVIVPRCVPRDGDVRTQFEVSRYPTRRCEVCVCGCRRLEVELDEWTARMGGCASVCQFSDFVPSCQIRPPWKVLPLINIPPEACRD